MSIAAPDAVNNIERDPRWTAVIARDRTADGRFFFSVRTTGVYCRPSCAARLANPKNVRFHDSAAKAEAAGFRPCKRCKPDQPSLEQQHAALVADACRAIETADTVPTLANMASASGLSPHHFHHVFKAITGLTPREYSVAHRAKRVRKSLVETERVTDAIYEAGLASEKWRVLLSERGPR
jgi:AraC family transcriptional regulator of adaptative response/methylated-DNA-[protein]-cysteine methyltransferase